MSRKKVSTTIYITPEQADRLRLLHDRTKVPIAVFIREGIDMMLKHYEHVLPGQLSLSGNPVTPGRTVGASTPPPPSVNDGQLYGQQGQGQLGQAASPKK